jgi:hypothetical protein
MHGRLSLRGSFLAGMCLLLASVVLLAMACSEVLDLKTFVKEQVVIANQEWRGTKAIVTGPAYAAAIGINGDNLYVLYYDSTAQRLKITKSADRGVTWTSPFIVDNTVGNYSTSNNLVIDGTEIYVSYQRLDSVYFIQLTDQGSTFAKSNGTNISTMLAGYPYGYENAVACDTQYVYVIYSAGSDPAFSKALKGSTLSFSTPKYIDSALQTNSGNRKHLSAYIDASGNVNACYYDATTGSEGLKNASFAPTDTLPISVNRINAGTISTPAYIVTDAGSTGIAGGPTFISYYDTAAKALKMYERFTYTYPPLMLGTVNTAATVDNLSSDVGQYSRTIYLGTSATPYTLYYDKANTQVKFAKGTKYPNNPPSVPPSYSYSSVVVGQVGGANMDCSLAYDQATGIFYAVFFDSSGSGALMFAKSMDGGVTW